MIMNVVFLYIIWKCQNRKIIKIFKSSHPYIHKHMCLKNCENRKIVQKLHTGMRKIIKTPTIIYY